MRSMPVEVCLWRRFRPQPRLLLLHDHFEYIQHSASRISSTSTHNLSVLSNLRFNRTLTFFQSPFPSKLIIRITMSSQHGDRLGESPSSHINLTVNLTSGFAKFETELQKQFDEGTADITFWYEWQRLTKSFADTLGQYCPAIMLVTGVAERPS